MFELDLEKAEEYLRAAYLAATNSKDTSNQNGALLVAGNGRHSSGVNNFPPGVKYTEERATTRPDKYRYFEHAERNAVYNAARKGVQTHDATLYCPWAACCPCARAIRCSGVTNIVLHKQRMMMTPERWLDDVNMALSMLEEAGVGIHYFDGPIVGTKQVIVNGELWWPFEEPAEGIGNHKEFVGLAGE